MATDFQIRERLISAPILPDTSGGVTGYAVYSERGSAVDLITINSIQDLENTIGKPTTDTIQDFLVCYDYLQYSSNLLLSRIIPDDAELARSSLNSAGTEEKISDTGITTFFTDYHEHNSEINGALEFWTKEPYDSGNSNNPVYKVYAAKYTGMNWATDSDSGNADTGQTLTIGNTGNDFSDLFEIGPKEQNDDNEDVNEIALVITENDIIVETHLVSTVSGKRNDRGENYFISDWLDAKSDYIWGFTTASDYDSLPDLADGDNIMSVTLTDGSKGSTPTQADVITAYNKFNNLDNIEVDYIIDGFHSTLRDDIQTIVGTRKDCIAFLNSNASSFFTGTGSSYYPSLNMFPIRNNDTIVDNIINDVQSIITGGDETKSRTCVYGNWKQVYDPYFDDYKWIPLTGSVSGAKTLLNGNANIWTPLAGDNAVLRNVEKLAFEPTSDQRKKIYKQKVNDVYTDRALGTIINGTKTLIDKNVGVARLNGRETLRIIEKFSLDNLKGFFHKFNNPATRSRVTGILESYLDTLLNRAVSRYQVVCDDTNNLDINIDNYELIIHIFVTLFRPIETIKLTIIDTPSGLSFNEINV